MRLYNILFAIFLHIDEIGAPFLRDILFSSVASRRIIERKKI